MKIRDTSAGKTKRKVIIVDDHPIVCQGLAQLINQESDLSVCRDAGDIPEALKAVKDYKPDAVIIDLSLGKSSGLRLIEELSGTYPKLSMLALSMHDENIYAERCLRAGARGYIMKKEPPEKIIIALRKILDREVYVSNDQEVKLLQKLINKTGTPASPLDVLSNRELEVFQFIGRGLKTREIAEQLHLSIKTIETYIEHIKKKMKFDNSRTLFLHAVQWVMGENKIY